MLDQAFEALNRFDYGTPLSEVQAIEDAIVASHSSNDPPNEARKDLEQRLIAALGKSISRCAKDFVCRKLAQIGSAASVPALANLLSVEGNSHLARHALERIPGTEATNALVAATSQLSGKSLLGAIGSLGTRRDDQAVTALTRLLTDSDPAVVRAAALSLGAIGGSRAAEVLQSSLKNITGDRSSLIDGLLSCAESLLAKKKADEASAIYQSLSGEDQPRLVQLAAARGLLACAGA
jgi:HEAT repeat protein